MTSTSGNEVINLLFLILNNFTGLTINKCIFEWIQMCDYEWIQFDVEFLLLLLLK